MNRNYARACSQRHVHDFKSRVRLVLLTPFIGLTPLWASHVIAQKVHLIKGDRKPGSTVGDFFRGS